MADTRKLILDAAWELFSERGFEDVSVRDVTNEAGVNLASVSYHFGGKKGLIQETVKLCLNPLFQMRVELLERAKEKYELQGGVPVSELIRCWILPVLKPSCCGIRQDLIQRILARYLIDLDYTVPTETRHLFTHVFQMYGEAFAVHYPAFSYTKIVQNIIFYEGAAIYYSGIGKILRSVSEGKVEIADDPDTEQLIEEVIAFSQGGFGRVVKAEDT